MKNMSTKNLTPLSPEFVKMLAQLGYVAVPKKAEIDSEIETETDLNSSDKQMNVTPNTATEEEINVDELLADLNDSSYDPPNLRFKYVN